MNEFVFQTKLQVYGKINIVRIKNNKWMDWVSGRGGGKRI